MAIKMAVIQTGGKQYRVSPGESLKIEKLSGELKAGSKITFDKVLLLDDGKSVKIGTPYIEGATVEAEFEEGGRNKKVTVLKYKRKTRYRKKYGHRQPYSKIKIK